MAYISDTVKRKVSQVAPAQRRRSRALAFLSGTRAGFHSFHIARRCTQHAHKGIRWVNSEREAPSPIHDRCFRERFQVPQVTERLIFVTNSVAPLSPSPRQKTCFFSPCTFPFVLRVGCAQHFSSYFISVRFRVPMRTYQPARLCVRDTCALKSCCFFC